MILVTGSEGFIGRNLVKYLTSKGEEIFGYDIKKSNDLFSIIAKIDFTKIKKIYHLGAISSTTEQDINKVYNHNVWFSVELFKKAIEHQIPVVYASSGSVYGNTIKDGSYIYSPLNYYASTKMMIDMWVTDHIHEFKHVAGLRFFNVYGNDEQKNDFSISPIYRFTQQAKNDGVIKIFRGSQHTYRDFVCVEDIINYMDFAMNGISKKGIYDAGTCNPISFLDVAELISTKYDVPIKFIDMPDIIKGKYQYYTKARPDISWVYPKSVEKWLEAN